MPNWIPILFVLLTQGASGSIATVHPHDMVRMIQLVAQWEDANSDASIIATVRSLDSKSSPKELKSTVAISGASASPAHSILKSTDLSRDGPPLFS